MWWDLLLKYWNTVSLISKQHGQTYRLQMPGKHYFPLELDFSLAWYSPLDIPHLTFDLTSMKSTTENATWVMLKRDRSSESTKMVNVSSVMWSFEHKHQVNNVIFMFSFTTSVVTAEDIVKHCFACYEIICRSCHEWRQHRCCLRLSYGLDPLVYTNTTWHGTQWETLHYIVYWKLCYVIETDSLLSLTSFLHIKHYTIWFS